MKPTLSRFESRLEAAHHWAVNRRPLHDFTILTRILLAAGFIPPGLVKLLGHRFTLIPTDDPIGAFFEALYQTGAFWHFIGGAQVLAGLLILVPATATLGAVLFVPIILNIFVITLSLDFRGTPLIAGLMLLANIYLLCWDGDKLRHLLPKLGRGTWRGTAAREATSGILRYAWWGFAGCALAVALTTRGFMPVPILGTLALPLLGALLDLRRLLQRRVRETGAAA